MEDLFKVALYLYAYDHMTRPLREVSRSLDHTRRAVERLTQAAEHLKAVGERVSLAGALVSGASAQATGALKSMVGPLLEVESATKAVATLYRGAGLEMVEVNRRIAQSQKEAIEWSKQHIQSARDFLSAQYQMLSAGLQHRAALEGTKVALTVATATMGDATEAANLLATVYNNLGDHARDVREEMWRIGDVITRTQQYFQIKNLAQLGEGLKYAVGPAKAARMSLEQLSVVIGMLNTTSLQGSMAGTAFAATLRELIDASQKLGFEIAYTKDGSLDFIKTLENIKAVYGDLTKLSEEERVAFQQAFGDEGLRAIILLSDKIEDMKKAYEDISHAQGVAREAQRIFESSSLAQLQILQHNLDALKMQLSAAILPAINHTIHAVVRLANALGRFAEAHPILTKFGMSFFFVTTGVLAVTASVLSLLGGIYMLSGYGLQALAKLIQGFVWLRGGVYATALRFKLFWNLIQARGGFLAFLDFQLLRLKYRFLEIVGSIRTAAIATWGWVTAQWASLRAAIAQAGGLRALSMAYLGRLLAGIRTAVAAVWSFNAALWANPLTWVAGAVVALATALWWLHKRFGLFSGALRRLTEGLSWFKEKVAALTTWLKEHWQAVLKVFLFTNPITAPIMALNKLVEYVSGLSLFEAGRRILRTLVEGLKSVAAEPVKALKAVLEKIRGLLPFSPARWGPLADLHLTGRRLMETVAAGIEPGLLVSKLTGALSALKSVLVESPLFLPAPAPAMASEMLARRTYTGSPLSINIELRQEIHVPGGPEKEVIEHTLRASAREFEEAVYRALIRVLERNRRLSFTGEA